MMYYPITNRIPAGKVAKGGHFIFSILGNLYRRTSEGFVVVCDMKRPNEFLNESISIQSDWQVYEVDPYKYIGSWIFSVWEYILEGKIL